MRSGQQERRSTNRSVDQGCPPRTQNSVATGHVTLRSLKLQLVSNVLLLSAFLLVAVPMYRLAKDVSFDRCLRAKSRTYNF